MLSSLRSDGPRVEATPESAMGRAIMRAMSGSPWWRNAVIYQVYLRSFADGTGDIAGLRSRFDFRFMLLP